MFCLLKWKNQNLAWRIKHGAQFEIADTGIGMNQKADEVYFERFYKADPSRAKIGSGESV